MCLTKDEKYLELREAINSLDDKAEVIEIQNVAKDNIITDIMNKFVVGNPRVWWLHSRESLKVSLLTMNFNIKELANSLIIMMYATL